MDFVFTGHCCIGNDAVIYIWMIFYGLLTILVLEECYLRDVLCTDQPQLFEIDKNCATHLNSTMIRLGVAQFSAFVIVPLLDQLKRLESRYNP